MALSNLFGWNKKAAEAAPAAACGASDKPAACGAVRVVQTISRPRLLLPAVLVTNPPRSLLLAALPAVPVTSSKILRNMPQEHNLGRISERATIVTLSEMRPITTRRIT